MRRLLFASVVAFGAAVGLVSAAGDGAPTAIAMALVGVLFAVPVGAALARGRQSAVHLEPLPDDDDLPSPISPEALATNYWRDKGQPPFSKLSDAEPDKHMFDPDKIV